MSSQFWVSEILNRIQINFNPSVTKRGFESERCLSVASINASATYFFLGPDIKSIISLNSGAKLIQESSSILHLQARIVSLHKTASYLL
jgi:hypothetical protein